MIEEIAGAILETDFTLLDTTHLSPNIVLEMGLTYGIGHRVYPIAEADKRVALNPKEFMFLLNAGIAKYTLDEKDIREVVDIILRKAKTSVSPAQMLAASSIGRIKIRVGQEPASLCVYYPSDRRPLWKRALGEIQGIARDRGYVIRIVDLLPHHNKPSPIDNLVWSLSKSERILIDTSGDSEPDLVGAFALGFATGLGQVGWRKEIRRLEEKGREHGGALGMWPGSHHWVWESSDELCDFVSNFLPRRGKGGKKT